MKHRFLYVFFCFLLSLNLYSQDTIVKGKRWNFLPVVLYNSDLGFEVGLLTSMYDFGDGRLYPNYIYNISYEIDITTRGSIISQLFFDSGKKIKNGKWRVVSDFSYIHEQASDFYGFNGYASTFHPEYIEQNNESYVSRMFYRYDRKIFRLTNDIWYKLSDHSSLIFGLHIFNYRIGTVNIDAINKFHQKNPLPDTTLLIDYYINNGFIRDDEAKGGWIIAPRLSYVYDGRDKIFNPTTGIYGELNFLANPKIDALYSKKFFRFSTNFKFFYPLFNKYCIMALRLGYQDQIGAQAPYYFMPYITQAFSNNTLVEGLGGGKSLRGIYKNRAWGDGFFYGNLEARILAYSFHTKKQLGEIRIKPFYDFGIITDPVKIPINYLNNDLTDYKDIPDRLHHSLGLGVHLVLNDNFIISVDVGQSLNKNDGGTGVYVTTGYNF